MHADSFRSCMSILCSCILMFRTYASAASNCITTCSPAQFHVVSAWFSLKYNDHFPEVLPAYRVKSRSCRALHVAYWYHNWPFGIRLPLLAMRHSVFPDWPSGTMLKLIGHLAPVPFNCEQYRRRSPFICTSVQVIPGSLVQRLLFWPGVHKNDEFLPNKQEILLSVLKRHGCHC